MFTRHIIHVTLLFACLVTCSVCQAQPDSKALEGLKPIGGFWYVMPGEPAVYFYKDAARYLDLFTYHAKDSNKDGIPNLKLSHDERCLIIESQGYPNHPTAVFPNSGNPNSMKVQQFVFRLPLVPQKANRIITVPMGAIGMALNGVVFFNPFEMGGMNAVEGYSEVWLDSCCGHPQQTGIYHYHKYPSCVKSPFPDDGKQHSPVIGFAWDGYPMYGPYEGAGEMARDLKGDTALDVCNGHTDAVRGYHYHVTPGRFPYIIGGYAGVVEAANNRGLHRAGTGAIENNAEPGTRIEAVITSVRPGTLARGKTHQVQIELDPKAAARRPVPAGIPTWAQIGPFEATKMTRIGNILSVELEIPEDSPVGVLFDCHIEFGERPPTVFKKNDVLRVGE